MIILGVVWERKTSIAVVFLGLWKLNKQSVERKANVVFSSLTKLIDKTTKYLRCLNEQKSKEHLNQEMSKWFLLCLLI